LAFFFFRNGPVCLSFFVFLVLHSFARSLLLNVCLIRLTPFFSASIPPPADTRFPPVVVVAILLFQAGTSASSNLACPIWDAADRGPSFTARISPMVQTSRWCLVILFCAPKTFFVRPTFQSHCSRGVVSFCEACIVWTRPLPPGQCF